ncbi:unnamed protein product [Tuber aestivum]|uniref:PAN2-PAN3 deadenylation complex subunit PAN3 n=1 Tax=Tuber aestivum TaxID=59557 RepID=A0A292PSS2_9PEZI|nr:unnamed protein product [Tuber aestivum]
MTERPSTASSSRAFAQSSPSLRPNTSSGPGISVTSSSPTGSRTTPPPEPRRSSVASSASSPRPKAKDSSSTICRNITIYGYCRFQDKGCAFNHDPHSQKQQSGTGRGKFNVDSPSFTPATPPKKTISPKTADAAPFTPKHNHSTGSATPPIAQQLHDAANGYSMAPALDPQLYHHQGLQHGFENMGLGENVYSPTRSRRRADKMKTNANAAMNAYDFTVGAPVNPYAQTGVDIRINIQFCAPNPIPHSLWSGYDFVNLRFCPIKLNYHLYAPLAPYPQKLQPFQKNIHGFFLSDNLREELQKKADATLQTLPAVSSILPPSIEEYHQLVPLDISNQRSAQVFGYPSWAYKAFSSEDGNAYALRRLEGGYLWKWWKWWNQFGVANIQPTNYKALGSQMRLTSELFKDGERFIFGPYSHDLAATSSAPRFVRVVLTLYFTTAIVFVYNYHPLSKTLAETHFGPNPRYPNPTRQHQPTGPIVPEQVLWSYIVQIASALKVIHSAGLAARVIEPSKILLTSKMRIRLNCCGIFDVIHPETIRSQESVRECQQEDLTQLGRLMLSIACNTPSAIQYPQKSMDYIGRHYSIQLRDSIYYLYTGSTKNIDEYVKSIANQAFQNFDSALHYEDSLESALSRELENGRLVRLLCKFGFINERPEYDHDPRWSETGDRYYLKLFRDYVFHSVDENNNPVVDMAHVLTCLNKLDAGVDEKIMLVSRDSMNCFVVSYKELKRQVESCFQDLSKSRR